MLRRTTVIAPRASVAAMSSATTTTATRNAHLGPYSVFMKRIWKDKTHAPILRKMIESVKRKKGVRGGGKAYCKNFGKVGKYMSAEYRKLSRADKAALVAAGKKITRKTRKPIKTNRYKKFVVKSLKLPRIKKLPTLKKRLVAISKKYKNNLSVESKKRVAKEFKNKKK